VLRALKKHGALVADNGNFFSISVTPDHRWPAGAFSHLSSVSVTNFEVIQTTGPAEGPRSPGAPVANAGPDQTVMPGASVQLAGHVVVATAVPAIQWRLYSGPGTVAFADSAKTNSTATFSAPGTYTLLLSADDGVHAVAYDAVVIRLVTGLRLSVSRIGSDVKLDWTGGNPPFTLESASSLPATRWDAVMTTAASGTALPVTNAAAFFRVHCP